MCRFFLAHSTKPTNFQKLFKEFVYMSQKSRTSDGDRQEDGWGIGWRDEKGNWRSFKSLKPIWKQINFSKKLKPTTSLIIHARSASFARHKRNLNYNQPFLSDGMAFVFNGMLKGVKLNRKLKGEIGAQKIYELIKEELINNSPQKSLANVHKLLLSHTESIEGMNIGLSDGKKLFAISEFKGNSEYFKLRYYNGKAMKMICSEKIGDFKWQTLEKQKVLIL